MPKTITPSNVFVNTDANNFFQKLEENDSNFGFVKLFCVPNKNGYLPFSPYYSVKNGIQYTCCSFCCDNNQNIENCNHSESERGYFVETYLTDALFFNKNMLGKIRIVEIIYFDSKYNNDLSYLANLLIKFRKTKKGLERIFSKQIALSAIGHFAFNVEKHCNNTNVLIDNYHELTFNLESKKNQNMDFYKNVLIARKHDKLSTYQNSLISTRLNCSSLLFGQVNNKIRRELYTMYLKSKSKSHYNILRFDTDALILSFSSHLTDNDIYNKMFNESNFNYKLEYKDIDQLINLKSKSHFFICKNKTIFKIPGLSLSVDKRNDIYYNGFKSLS